MPQKKNINVEEKVKMIRMKQAKKKAAEEQ